MKKFFKFLAQLAIYFIAVVSIVYLLANAILYLLPADTKDKVMTALHISPATVFTLTGTATVNLAILLVAKWGQIQSKNTLNKKLAEVNVILQEASHVNESAAEKAEQVVENQQMLKELVLALLAVQKINVERNLKASTTLVQPLEKEAYTQVLQQIQTAVANHAALENKEKTIAKKIVLKEQKQEGKV